MPHLDPTREQIEALLAAPDDEPVLMLNQLRFREQASYPEDSDATPCTGSEAYGRYAEVAMSKIERLGGEIVWMVAARQVVIGPDSENWDQCFVVRYPSKQAFVEMISAPEYKAALPHRTAALADSRLIRCAEPEWSTAPSEPSAS